MTGVTVGQNRESLLTRLGFRIEKSSTHTSRTIMLEDLEALFAYVDQADADKEKFRHAIEAENCLGKRSVKTRTLTYRHLSELYALDPAILLFRALRFFWDRDPAGRPLLALLCAYARDSLLRMSSSFILKHPEGAAITREALEACIEENAPDRFSPATLKSTAQNLNSSWTKSGHLSGRQRKIRSRAIATPGSVAYVFVAGISHRRSGGIPFSYGIRGPFGLFPESCHGNGRRCLQGRLDGIQTDRQCHGSCVPNAYHQRGNGDDA